MKIIIKFIAIVCFTIIAVDSLFGVICSYYTSNYHIPGDYKTVDHLLKNPKDEVYILGSSIALNSANPMVIEDSIKMSVWNGAANAQTLAYCDVMAEKLCSYKNNTKAIILGLRPTDFNGGNGRINLLMPYYHTGINSLDNYLEDDSMTKRLLFKSSLYRYNTIWFRILLYNFIEPGEKGEKGFIAKPIPPLKPTLHCLKSEKGSLSTKGIKQIENIQRLCKKNDVSLFVYLPPMYDKYEGGADMSMKAIEELCTSLDIPIINSSQDSTFLSHPEWFFDNVHLNKNGANEYSQILGHWLSSYLRK